jgi:hypothetical protein
VAEMPGDLGCSSRRETNSHRSILLDLKIEFVSLSQIETLAKDRRQRDPAV